MNRHLSAVVIALLVYTQPVSTQDTTIADLRVLQAAAEVHKFPSVGSPVVGKVAVGTVVEVRRNLGSWVEVPWPAIENGIAYLHVNTGTITPRPATVQTHVEHAPVVDTSKGAAALTSGASTASGARVVQPATNRYTEGRPATYVSLPSHRIGMGALMIPSKPEFGATFRTWGRRGIGAQFHLSRPQLEDVDRRSVESTQLAPSVLYSLPQAVTDSMWLRPYVGTGPRLYRANLETRWGYEALGGVEATLPAMPQFALSADIGYRLSRPSFNGFAPRRVGFSLSGHWYVN